MAKARIKELRFEISVLANRLDNDMEEAEYNALVDKINGLIAEYHDARFERMLQRGEVMNRAEYDKNYGVYKW